jgi:hypothetical protein
MFEGCDRESLRGYARKVIAGEVTIAAQVPSGDIGTQIALPCDDSDFDVEQLTKSLVYRDDSLFDACWRREIWDHREEKIIPFDLEPRPKLFEFAFRAELVKEFVDGIKGWLKPGFYELYEAKKAASRILEADYGLLSTFQFGPGVDQILVEGKRHKVQRVMTIEGTSGAYVWVMNNEWMGPQLQECAFVKFFQRRSDQDRVESSAHFLGGAARKANLQLIRQEAVRLYKVGAFKSKRDAARRLIKPLREFAKSKGIPPINSWDTVYRYLREDL